MDYRADWPGYFFEAGQTYRGLPYANDVDSSLEEFLSHLDENGSYTGPTDFGHLNGVDCSSSVLAAWGRAASSFDYVWTYAMLPFNANSALKVGDYTVSGGVDATPNLSNPRLTSTVTTENGEQTMYAAYAQLLPGDAVVNYTLKSSGVKSGHARMVSAQPVVVYEEGVVSGVDSYILTHEITPPVNTVSGEKSCWLINKKYTFNELFRDGYLPLTCQELKDGVSPELVIGIAGGTNTSESVAANKGLAGRVESNYRIYEVEATITSKATGEVVRRAVDNPQTTDATIPVSQWVILSKKYDLAKLNEKLDLAGLSAGGYILTLKAKAADRTTKLLELDFHMLGGLRQQVVDYLNQMAEVVWAPSETLDFTTLSLKYEAGQPYKGLLYVNEMDSTLEEFLGCLDGGSVYTGPSGVTTAIGVDGSSAIHAAWAQVSPSFAFTYTEPMVPSREGGAVPVGEYDMGDLETNPNIPTAQIVQLNEAAVMYDSYAKLQPGDAIITNSSPAHTAMVIGVEIVRNGDAVVASQSKVRTRETAKAIVTEGDLSTTWSYKEYTFQWLRQNGYVPVTLPELRDEQKPAVTLDVVDNAGQPVVNDGPAILENGGLAGTLKSNYRIVSITASLTGSKNAAVTAYPLNTKRLTTPNPYYFEMVSKSFNLAGLNAGLDLSDLPAGSYTLTVAVRAGGEDFTLLDEDFTVSTGNPLRDKVVRAMKEMATVQWTAAADMANGGNTDATGHTAGVTYYGMPFVIETKSYIDSSLMEFEAALDENGVYQGPTAIESRLGVDYGSAVIVSWATVSPTVNEATWSSLLIPAANKGVIKVGEYESITGTTVNANNTAKTMYGAYAQLLPGDAVMKRGGSVAPGTLAPAIYAGMVTSSPVVIRDEAGEITGDSYILVTEVRGHPVRATDNSSWNIDKKYTFAQLYNESFIPITCNELKTGESPAIEHSLTVEQTAQSVLTNKGLSGSVTSNYRIFKMEARIADGNGVVHSTSAYYPPNKSGLTLTCKNVDLTRLNSALNVEGLAEGDYTLTLKIWVADTQVTICTVGFTK